MRAAYAFIERNLFLVKRYWGWEFAFLVYAVAGALSITFIGKARARPPAPVADDRRHLLELPVHRVRLHRRDGGWERWEGTLEYTFMAPIRRWVHLLGSTMFAMIYGLVHTTVDPGRDDAVLPARPVERELRRPALVIMLLGSFTSSASA